ncbi:MAG: PKD domain-containing protein [Sandaracinaceae bacterium]
MRNWLMGLCALACLGGCGTRSALSVDPPVVGPDSGRDAGRDGGFDGGFDAGPPDAGMILLDCGRRDRYTTPRLAINIMPTVEGSSPPLDAEWTLLDGPPGPDPELRFTGTNLAFTPFTEGDFLVSLNVVDGMGRTASCELEIHSVVGPPVAICPEEPLRTQEGQGLLLLGDGFDDNEVVAYQWDVLETPEGGSAVIAPPTDPVSTFVGDTRGDYLVQLTAIDADMAVGTCQVTVSVKGPPEVQCPPNQDAPTRRPVSLTASDMDDVGIVSRRWELLERPGGSETTPAPLDMQMTQMTPDRQGDYRLRYTVTDVEGFTASCEVVVTGTPTPPDVRCPAEVEVAPLETAEVTATAVDDGEIASWRWQVTETPEGSGASQPSPAGSATTRFTPDIAGVYTLTVVATDDDGMTGTCTTRVVAGNVDGIRIEMNWDTTGTDMDLHLLNNEATRWQTNDDCYYSNCNTSGSGVPVLDWYGRDDEDDPRLDIDDTDGMGPENINIEQPEPGTYRVAVHNFGGAGPNAVRVNIYCGGSTTEPRQRFGPAILRGFDDSGSNSWWRVADITVTAAGCTITDLSNPDGSFNIERARTAINRR